MGYRAVISIGTEKVRRRRSARGWTARSNRIATTRNLENVGFAAGVSIGTLCVSSRAAKEMPSSGEESCRARLAANDLGGALVAWIW